jgi:hypothetical protein
MRRKVDLPQPDGPISAVTVLGRIARETSSSTWLSPNHAATISLSSTAGTSATASGCGVTANDGSGWVDGAGSGGGTGRAPGSGSSGFMTSS